jgi:hypothetical protein
LVRMVPLDLRSIFKIGSHFCRDPQKHSLVTCMHSPSPPCVPFALPSLIFDEEYKLRKLASRSPIANPKSGPDYSVFIFIYIFQFYIPREMFSRTP